MHPFYLVDYINRIKRDLKSDVEFLSQGLHSTYKLSTKRTSDDVQWAMAEVARCSVHMQKALELLEQNLEKVNVKEPNASTKI